MANDWQDEEGLPEKRPARTRRRGPTRAQVMRRRLVALASLLGNVVLAYLLSRH